MNFSLVLDCLLRKIIFSVVLNCLFVLGSLLRKINFSSVFGLFVEENKLDIKG